MIGLSATERPTSWWLDVMRRRASKMDAHPDLSAPMTWATDDEHRAAIKFFNAAFRAEESGLTQAHELAQVVGEWDPDLAEVLRLYGNEEGWHRELLTSFLQHIGGEIQPMGRVTRTFYQLYARAKRMETIVLTNLMFETIGATTYRLALRNVRQSSARHMLTILTRDESFHVPLNVHFLRQVLRRRPASAKLYLRALYKLLFTSLVLLPIASRPKAQAFDGLGTRELSRAYAEQLTRLFARERDLDFRPPWLVLFCLGLTKDAFDTRDDLSNAGIEAAERAANREDVSVTAL